MDTSKSGSYEYRFQDVSDANYNPHAKSRSNLVLQQQIFPRPTARFSSPGKVFNYCTSEATDESVIPITFTGVPPFELDLDLRSSGTVSPESITLNNIQSKDFDLRLPRKYLRVGHASLTIRRVRDGRSCQSKDDPSVEPSRVQISVHNPPQIYPEDPKTDICVSEKVNYRLQGVPPFTIYWTLNGENKHATISTPKFERLSDKPGELVITGLSDSSSACRFSTSLTKTIHPLPKVLVNAGKTLYDDIHEGGEHDFPLEFFGTPPFEYTYTRSDPVSGAVLETKTERTEENKIIVRGREAGSYDVISIRDRWCGVAKNNGGDRREPGYKLLAQGTVG
jgi:nucleoporin POM152